MLGSTVFPQESYSSVFDFNDTCNDNPSKTTFTRGLDGLLFCNSTLCKGWINKSMQLEVVPPQRSMIHLTWFV